MRVDWNDKKQVLEMLKGSSRSDWFKYAHPDLKNERAFVLEALRVNGLALEHVGDEFRADREIVMTAIAKNGVALQHSKGRLVTDKEVVKTAIE
jgi:hypothetical protein